MKQEGITQLFWSKSGVAASRPAATGLRDGSIWYSTDSKDLDQVQAASWVTIFDYSEVGQPVALTYANLII